LGAGDRRSCCAKTQDGNAKNRYHFHFHC
jgi:hypothetical protein